MAGLKGHDYATGGKPDIAWDDPGARDLLVSALVTDALTVLEQLAGVDLDPGQGEAVALLALVAGQDVEPAQGSDGTDRRWRIARKVAQDRVISTVDPQARHAHKSREKKQDGFKAHVVVEPDTGLITAAALTMAAGADNSDAARGIELLDADTTITDDPDVQVLADSAYGSGDMLAAVETAGRVALIKPMPIQRPVPGGLTIDNFTVDHTARTVTCPAGATRPVSAKGRVNFGAVCALSAPCGHGARPPLGDESSSSASTTRSGANTASEPALPPPPPHGRTVHRLAHPRCPPRPLPRGDEERRLVDTARRLDQPAYTPTPGTATRPRELGHDLTRPPRRRP
ncbi:transposase [Cellulomonas fimi]|uniref:Transposase n=1 Tax=Cellulomonas fimi TaxID=1708 RepID=A0A7Y0M0A9_CELFI|nr:transposase [Cellulomonas fimi]